MLPLSLEDNSTVFGTMSILNDFSKQFNLLSQTKAEYLPFDLVTGNFNIVSARNHFELLLSQQNHVQRRKSNERQLRSTEKSWKKLRTSFLTMNVIQSRNGWMKEMALVLILSLSRMNDDDPKNRTNHSRTPTTRLNKKLTMYYLETVRRSTLAA